MSHSDQHIRVVTLNCWGLKYVSKNRVTRIDAIARFLSTAPYDIVCLQELFVSQDYETIRASLSSHLPFVKLFHGGAVGQGLAIFSRFSIIAATIQQFSLNGSPLDLVGADWFAGKAAASILIKHPVLGQVQIFNTHFFSEGGDDGPEHHRAHRLVNAWEFAKLVNQASELGHYVIALGDFNSAPHTLPITVILEHAGLEDAWASLHPPPHMLRIDKNHVNAADALSSYGFTYNSPLNSYSTREPLDTQGAIPQGARLDYILFRNPIRASSTYTSSDQLPQISPTEAHVAFANFVPGHAFSYSDHFGVEATFKIDHIKRSELIISDFSTNEEAPTIIPRSVTAVQKPHLGKEHITKVLDALKTHLTNQKLRSRWELRIFVACVIFLVSTLIGTGWSPKGFLTPVFVFLGALVTWLGTTMFYVGFLYGRWEVSLLRNVIEEMEIYVENIG